MRRGAENCLSVDDKHLKLPVSKMFFIFFLKIKVENESGPGVRAHFNRASQRAGCQSTASKRHVKAVSLLIQTNSVRALNCYHHRNVYW